MFDLIYIDSGFKRFHRADATRVCKNDVISSEKITVRAGENGDQRAQTGQKLQLPMMSASRMTRSHFGKSRWTAPAGNDHVFQEDRWITMDRTSGDKNQILRLFCLRYGSGSPYVQ